MPKYVSWGLRVRPRIQPPRPPTSRHLPKGFEEPKGTGSGLSIRRAQVLPFAHGPCRKMQVETFYKCSSALLFEGVPQTAHEEE